VHENLAPSYDVTIVGAGLAGLALARQLLLYTDKTVLLLDKRLDPPGPSQKVGESLVQTSGYYLSKVLDLEEHLFCEHYFKYNLRFQWKTPGLENRSLEDYSKSFIRMGSNLATFQLDRNLLEAHLLKICGQNPRFHFEGGVAGLETELAERGPHRVAFSGKETQCGWLVDASGRGQFLKKKLGLLRENPIRHGSTWCWVEGLVNIEKLTDLPWSKVRNNRDRMKQGSFPQFLATNHFAGEGRWFWVIPLHGKTSLGLVYDKSVITSEDVSTARKMLDYVCREWPLFERDLPHRKVLDEGRFFDYSYDAQQTISPQRWAMSGEAGRFSDPLYSPGGDLISIYNTLIVDAIQTGDQASLERKCRMYETVMRVVYEAYVPSYAVSYDCLGDQQSFMYKYGWELAVYFGFYVLPFINDLFTDEEFLPFFLRKFGLLGPINLMLQKFLSDFFQWKKKANVPGNVAPELHDFYEMMPLRNSELLFYQVGLTREEATEALERQLNSLKGFARWIVAQVYATVLGDPMIGMDTGFIKSIKLRGVRFDPDQMRAEYSSHGKKGEMAVA
jgi:2-polyprenyl-6-methoxyphenol hydroxylase-like FAD-dependent oxidoreductase